MKQTYISRLLVFIMGLLVFASCEDLIVEEPYSLYTDENFYETDKQAISAINGVYRCMVDRDNSLTPYSSYGMAGALMMMDMMSDMCYSEGNKTNYGGQIATGTHAENEVVSNNMWALSYLMINKANNVIGNVPNIEMDSVLQQRILGEARFLRAYAYFNLAKFWGKVPLRVEETRDYEPSTTQIERSEIQEVFQVILEDLEFAEKSLFFKYGSYMNGGEFGDYPLEFWGRKEIIEEEGLIRYSHPKLYLQTDNGRASIEAARGMLARVHLFLASMNKFGNVEGYDWVDSEASYRATRDYCKKIIDYGNYALVDDYIEYFSTDNKHNSETMFEIEHYELEGNGGIWGYWHGDSHRIRARVEYLDLFDAELSEDQKFYVDSLTDARLIYSANVREGKDNLEIAKFGYKSTADYDKWGMPAHLRFSNFTNAFNNAVNVPVMRYADILLMMAESINEIEGPGRSYQYINQLRSRARRSNFDETNIPGDVYGMTRDEFRFFVWDERKRELSFECHNFEDLVRTGTFMEKISSTKKVNNCNVYFLNPIEWIEAPPSLLADNVEEHHQLFPVPLSEINVNHVIDQNPGY